MQRKLDDWIEGFLKYTAKTEPKEIFRKWAAVSTIAAALRRKCFTYLGTSEVFYPNLYVVLVGPPAARKGTAMRPAKSLLDAIGVTMASDESSRQKLISRMVESCQRYQDEDDRQILHSSMTIFQTELTVFLKASDPDMLSSLCKWYDCENKFEYDTHARGTEMVVNVWVNLFAATTPMMLQTALPYESFGSGFVSRTIFVYEEAKNVEVWPELNLEMESDLQFDLEKVSVMGGEFKWDKDVREPYTQWRLKYEYNEPMKDPKLETYTQRRPTHLIKLCMIFSASRSQERIITVEDFTRASDFLELTERKMPWVFRGVGQNPMAGVQSRIMRMLMDRKEISMADLQAMFMDDVGDKDLWQIVATLEHSKFCKMDLHAKRIALTYKEK